MGVQTFTRQSILQVSAKRASHRGRNTFIGLIIGAAAGVVVPVASPELDFAYVGSHGQLVSIPDIYGRNRA